MEKRTRSHIIRLLLFVAFLLFVSVAAFMKGALILLVIGLGGGIILLSYRLDIGLYIMVFLTPLIGWQFHADYFRSFLGDNSSLLEFYVPMVDFWTIILMIAYAVYLLRKWLKGEKHKITLPGIGLFTLFLLSAVLSLFNVSGSEFGTSISYIIRFPLFIYVGYIILGTNIIRDKIILDRALSVYAWVGCAGALMGLVSLFVGSYGVGGLHRAVPLSIFGWAPLSYVNIAYGPILLAEMLTTAFPVMLYLAYRAKQESERMLYLSMSALTAVITLLTFSRSGWLTLMFEISLCAYFMRTSIPWDKVKKFLPIAGVVVVPLAIYMLLFLRTTVVSSSNSTRLALTQIGWELFLEHPVLGQGVGTFLDRLSEVRFFLYEFGEPIDAHSILTKISTEQGVVGIITFALFIGWVCTSIYTRMKDNDYSPRARMVALLSFFLVAAPIFFQLFNTQYYSARMWIPIVFAMSMNLVYRDESKNALVYTHFRPDKYKIERKIK